MTWATQRRKPSRDRSEEFSSFVLHKPKASMARPDDKPQAFTPVVAKTPDRKQQSIRDSANGEPCEIRLPGCDDGGATTVWCHLPELVADRGMGLKGVDFLGAAGCFNCHEIVDRRAPRPPGLTEIDVALAFYRGMARSLVKLRQKGLV